MNHNQRESVVGVFHNRSEAQTAIQDLRRAGFADADIGLIGKGGTDDWGDFTADESYAGEGAVAGAATGAGAGILWGLGVLAGAIPAIGPAIAGGTLAALFSSAAAGAAAAGLGGMLIGLGLPKDEADYYDSEFKAGRTVVTVKHRGRADEAVAIMRRHGGYDSTNRGTRTTDYTDVPVTQSTLPPELPTGKNWPGNAGHKTYDVPVDRADVTPETPTVMNPRPSSLDNPLEDRRL